MSTATIHPRAASGERIAAEAERYLEVVAAFAAAGVDPHAAARATADRAREREQARSEHRRWFR